MPQLELERGPRFGEWHANDTRLAFFDVDQTLVEVEGREPPSDTFIEASMGRTAVSLATGRPFQKVEHILEAADVKGRSVLSNGAQVFDGSTGEMQYELKLPTNATEDLARVLQREGITHWVQDDGVDFHWQGQGPSSITGLDRYNYATPVNIWERISDTNKEVVPIYEPQKPFVIVAVDLNAEQCQTMIEAAEVHDGVSALIAHESKNPDGSKSYVLFFTDKNSNKETALHEISEETGISLEEFGVVGDGRNDTEMMKIVGTAVAMDNAAGVTKAAAHFIAPHFNDDGAAKALKAFNERE